MRVKDEQKIDLFYSSTLALVSQVGLVGLTIPLIAKTSGVATGTLYIYFKNKEDLILALHKKIKNSFGAYAFVGYNPDLPIRDGLRVIWENCLRYAVLNYQEQVFLQQFSISPYSKDKGQLLYALEAMAPLFQSLQAAQSQLLIKSDKEGLTVKLLFGFVTQIAADLHEAPQLLTRSYIDKTFCYFWDAIKI
jgi:AcrR family transcriptional regulator